jgi:tRNA nucleotidyltransferase (CCA-adding enzyme)
MRNSREESILSRIRPTPEEKEHISRVATQLIAVASGIGRAEPLIVGSVARGTFIRGDRDLDLFLLFEPDLPREELEREGLALARNIAESLRAPYHEKYAEHPYINANLDGLDVDLVPCYRVESAAAIRSAVDRTPFHTRYIEERIEPFVDDVLLLKQFAKAGGVYGSDQMTEGFSGYLCELLILHYRGFSELLAAAAEWRPGTLIDPGEHRTKEFGEPLVVVDPVDPGRNVSASVSLDRMYEFVELARAYRDNPSDLFFFPRPDEVLSHAELEAVIRAKGTSLVAITFATPPFIPEVIVPQLRRSLDSVCALLERNGFFVNYAACEMHEDRSMLLFELMNTDTPKVRRHIGPPLWNRSNTDRFIAKYRGCSAPDIFGGPFIEDGRYIVEIARKFTRVEDLLRSADVLDVGLGKHVRQSMSGHWEVLSGVACWSPAFAPFISRFLARKSPLMRILGNGESGE